MKLAVLCVAYNSERTIKRAIESVLGQTYPDFDFYCINDGSTDSTFQMLKQYESLDYRLKVVNQENMGLTYSLYLQLKRLHNYEWIARIDADDEWLPEKLDTQIHELKRKPDLVLIGTNIKVVQNNKNFHLAFPEHDSQIRRVLKSYSCIDHSAAMFRHSYLDSYCNYDPKFYYSQDYDLWLRLRNYGKFHNCQKYLVIKHLDKNAITIKRRAYQRMFSLLAKNKNGVLTKRDLILTAIKLLYSCLVSSSVKRS